MFNIEKPDQNELHFFSLVFYVELILRASFRDILQYISVLLVHIY